MPNAPLQGTAPFTVTLPFTMEGSLSGRFYPNGINGQSQFFSAGSIYGSGSAQLSFYYVESSSLWTLRNYEYTFSATPEPTPEPTTIFLMGTGLVGIVGYAKKRRKKRQNT